MKYCVLVKISKHSLCFWYQLEGSEYSPLSMKEGNNIPLCFYVNGNDFNLGQFALERSKVNDPNIFNHYFELIKDPSKHFTLYGDNKPIKLLIYYGIEIYLSHFIKSVLYKNDSIEAYRTNFCLRIWFDEDIENPEKILISNLFKEAGYENANEININEYLRGLINSQLNSSRLPLVITALNNDLYIKHFLAGNNKQVFIEKIEGHGSDPRAKILANLIIEDIKEANPHIHIDLDKDIQFILGHCVKLLNNLTPIMRNDIILSSGVNVDYKIRLSQLEDRLIYSRGIEDLVIPKIEEHLIAYALNVNLVDIVLLGDQINTDYFKDKLLKKFTYVSGFDSQFEKNLINNLFFHVARNNYTFAEESLAPNHKIPSPLPGGHSVPPMPIPVGRSTVPVPMPGSRSTVSPPLPGAHPTTPPSIPVPRPFAPPPIPVNRTVAPPPMPGAGRPISPPPLPGGSRPIPPLPSIKEPSNASRTSDSKLDNQKKNNVSPNSIPPPPPPPPVNSSSTSVGVKKNNTIIHEKPSKSNAKSNPIAKNKVKNKELSTSVNNDSKSVAPKFKDITPKKDKKSEILKIANRLYTVLLQYDSQAKNKIYVYPNINLVKFENMINKLGFQTLFTDCIIQYDDTFFGAGDNGFIITEKYVMWKNYLEAGYYISWNDIMQITVDGDTKVILKDKNGFDNVINTAMIRKSLNIASCMSDILKIIKN